MHVCASHPERCRQAVDELHGWVERDERLDGLRGLVDLARARTNVRLALILPRGGLHLRAERADGRVCGREEGCGRPAGVGWLPTALD
eukprot:356310-Chlamydomonas_euryale.AAC.1